VKVELNRRDNGLGTGTCPLLSLPKLKSLSPPSLVLKEIGVGDKSLPLFEVAIELEKPI
jgi:hypothetical protein